MRDLYNNIEVRRGFSPAAAVTDNTAYVSQIIDMRGFKSLVWCILLGSLVDADMTTVFLMEDGDDSGLSDAAAVADVKMDPTEIIAAFDFGDDNTVRKIGYVGEKRYVRLTITPSANTGDMFVAVMALLGDADRRPTTAQATSV
jgi:hypothetical protein